MRIDPEEIRRRADTARAAEQANRALAADEAAAHAARRKADEQQSYSWEKERKEAWLPEEVARSLKKSADMGFTGTSIEVGSYSGTKYSSYAASEHAGGLAAAQSVADKINSIPGMRARVTEGERTHLITGGPMSGPTIYSAEKVVNLRVDVVPDNEHEV